MIQELENIIVDNIRQIPKKPLSVLLSGGIDSSLVLALLHNTYPDIPLYTFTLVRTKDYPDVIFAREVAGMFGTKHHEIILSHEECDDYEKSLSKIDEHGDINFFILCSIAKKYSDIIVTGDGGDECFGGYWLHEHPLGHKETGVIKSFEEIHPTPAMHVKEMVETGFRDYLFKEKSVPEDYDAVWEYFVKRIALRRIESLLNTAKVLNVKLFTPLWSESLLAFLKHLPYISRVGRKVEKELAAKYLSESIIKRESIGFDVVFA